MLDRPPLLGLNHVLGQHPWARQSLMPFAGRIIEFRIRPLPDLRLQILPDGLLQSALPEAGADLTIILKPSALPFLLARDEALMREVEMRGSADLAQVVQQLYRDLQWDIEDDLSRVFGDILAHRMAGAGRDLLAWQREATLRLAQNFAEYWTEEQPVIAHSDDLTRFRVEVDRIRDDVERLEKRIEAQERSLSSQDK